MLRFASALLASLSIVSCAAVNRGATAVVFEPPSGEEAAATERQVQTILATVPVEAFEAHTFQASNGVSFPYRLFRPPVSSSAPPALVVIFHGSGAIGTDNRGQIGQLARSWATADAQRKFPAYVLVPQFPERTANYSKAADGSLVSQGTPLIPAAVELIERIRAGENIADRKVYAIGFSMGGSALWHAMREAPQLFSRAAIVGGVPPARATAPAATTLLLVHGDRDDENPFGPSWKAFTDSRGQIEFWRFRNRGHEFPQELIAGDRLREWLFTRE